jgi:hypothetical protein
MVKTRPGYRMRELVTATGQTKSTILFYLSQGLLPEPARTGSNTALYHPSCVERIRLIRRLQSHDRLTLAEIRERLSAGAQAAELSPTLQSDDAPCAEPASGNRFGRTEFCRAAGLTPVRVDELVRSGLLRPIDGQLFDAADLEMARGLAAAGADGLRPEDLAFYLELGRAVAGREMDLLDRFAGRRSPGGDADVHVRIFRLARVCRAYLIERLFHEHAAERARPTAPAAEREREREPWLD